MKYNPVLYNFSSPKDNNLTIAFEAVKRFTLVSRKING